MDGHVLPSDAVSASMMYIVLYLVIAFFSVILLLLSGSQPLEAFSGVFSSIGCVGPGLGSIGSLGNFSAQPVVSKLVLSLDMFLGRIEIFPFLIVVSMIFQRRK